MITMEMFHAAIADAVGRIAVPWYSQGATADEDAMTVTVSFYDESGVQLEIFVIPVSPEPPE
jgi:hypothetical protein